MRQRDGEQGELLQTRTAVLDLISLDEGDLGWTEFFLEILQEAQQQVSVEGVMWGREEFKKEEDESVVSFLLRHCS